MTLPPHTLEIPKSSLRFIITRDPLNDGNDGSAQCTMRLLHPGNTKSCLAFKVKTTHPRRYLVRPNQGIIAPNSSETVSIVLADKYRQALLTYCERMGTSTPKIFRSKKEKIQVSSCIVSEELSAKFTNEPRMGEGEQCKKELVEELTAMWNAASSDSNMPVYQKKLGVSHVVYTAGAPVADGEAATSSSSTGGVASVGNTESSSSAVTLGDRVSRCGLYLILLLPVYGFLTMLIGGTRDIAFTVGLILYLSPFFCMGLGLLRLSLLGFHAIVRGMRMRGVGFVEAVTGLIIVTQSSIVLVAIVDIALHAPEMFFFLLFSVNFILLLIVMLCQLVWTATLACINRWGIILQAKVHKRRRHRRENKDDDGMVSVTYEHELLVTYEVEASHEHCWGTFGYQRVSSSTTGASSIDDADEEDQVGARRESNGILQHRHRDILDEGRPVQPGLVQEKTDDNAIPYTRQCIQKWLTVNESQYGSRSDFVEVSALPSWPQISVATETLPQSIFDGVLKTIMFTAFAAIFSVPSVFLPRDILVDCLWHVKASYILLSILLPSLPLTVYGMLLLEKSGSHVPNESSQELPIVRQSTYTRGSVAEDDKTAITSTSTLFMNEDVLPSTTSNESSQEPSIFRQSTQGSVAVAVAVTVNNETAMTSTSTLFMDEDKNNESVLV